MNKTRIDKLLLDRKITKSRERAKFLIKEGKVFADGKVIKNASAKINIDTNLEIKGKDIQWVSRGGIKLEKALKIWNINPKEQICLDVGASTGGFTDVLISNGAKKVYALDVGHGQLDEKLKNNPKVVNIEKINARKIDKKIIQELVDFVCVDVSFISLTLVMPEIIKFLKPKGIIVALLKPQFELGKGVINKSGVVKRKAQHELVIKKIKLLAADLNLCIKGITESPILGKSGNKEFLVYLKK
ncbi:MAG: TlyA family RNA methyltransferase [Patescibacteria group bacterium]|nr:TlyA family RNA methyltransferase [Patescibacteria group bacterium]